MAMRFLKLAMTLVCFLIALPASAQGWIEFVDREELFGINLPHTPSVEDIVYTSEFGTDFPAKVFTASDEQTNYKITVVNYADSPIQHPWRVWDFTGSVAYAAWQIRKRGGDITYDGWTEADRIPGHQLQITNLDQSRTYAAIHAHGTRLYIFEAIAAPGAVPPIHFQQSVVILDEAGEIVRYDTDFRTRIDPGR
jgi:hypothetical protein